MKKIIGSEEFMSEIDYAVRMAGGNIEMASKEGRCAVIEIDTDEGVKAAQKWVAETSSYKVDWDEDRYGDVLRVVIKRQKDLPSEIQSGIITSG